MHGIADRAYLRKPDSIVSQTIGTQRNSNWNFGEGTNWLAEDRKQNAHPNRIVLGASPRDPLRLSGTAMTESIENQFHAAGNTQLIENTEEIFLNRVFAEP